MTPVCVAFAPGVGARATDTPEPELAALASVIVLEWALVTDTGPVPPAAAAAPICVLPSVVSTWPASAVESPLALSTANAGVGSGTTGVETAGTAGTWATVAAVEAAAAGTAVRAARTGDGVATGATV